MCIMALAKLLHGVFNPLSFSIAISYVFIFTLLLERTDQSQITELEGLAWTSSPHGVLQKIPIPPTLRRMKRDLDDESDEEECKKLPPKQPNSRLSENVHINLMDLLNNGSSYMMIDDDDVKEAVLVLGNTGSGKTTLTQIIAGDLSKLHAVTTKSKRLIIIDDEDRIGAPSTISKTLVPELVRDAAGTALYDCPGFDDTRGPEKDITANFFINQITRKVAQVKLLFLVIHNSVTPGQERLDFDLLVSHAIRFLKDIPKYTSSFGLVVTKVDSYDHAGKFVKSKRIMEEIVAFLTMYLKDLASQLNSNSSTISRTDLEKKIQFVETLLQENEEGRHGQISFSRSPIKCGPLSDSNVVSDTRKRVGNLYSNELEYAGVSPGDFGFTLKDSTKLAIVGFVSSLNEGVTRGFSNIMNEFKTWLDMTHLQAGDNMNKIQALRSAIVSLDGVLGAWNSLRDQSNPEDLLGILKHHLGPVGFNISTSDQKFIQQQQSYFVFFDEVNAANVSRAPRDWPIPIEEVETELKKEEEHAKLELRNHVEFLNQNFTNEISNLSNGFVNWYTEMHLQNTIDPSTKLEEIQKLTFEFKGTLSHLEVLGSRNNPKDFTDVLLPSMRRLGFDVPANFLNYTENLQAHLEFDDEVNAPGINRAVKDWLTPIANLYGKLKDMEEKAKLLLTIYEKDINITSLQKELNISETQVDSLQGELITRNFNITELSNQLKLSIGEIVNVTAANRALRGELKLTTDQVSFLQHEVTSSQSINEELSNQLKIANDWTQELGEEILVLKGHAKMLQGQLGTQQEEFELRNKAIERKWNESRRAAEEHRNSVQEKQKQVQLLQRDLKSKIALLKNEIVTKQDTIEKQLNDIERLQDETDELKARLGLNENQVRSCQMQIVTKQDTIEKQLNDIERLQDETDELKARLRLNENQERSCQMQIVTRQDTIQKLNATCMKNNEGDTELHLAVNRGDVKAVKDLVAGGACLDSRNNDNSTPLVRAARLQDLSVGLEIIKFLIDQGANVYTRDNHYNSTFLHHFTSSRTTPQQFHDITVYLISKNLSNLFTLEALFSRTPLQYAVRNMKEDVMFATLSLLRSNSIDFNKVDMYGDNIFSLALAAKRTTSFLSNLIALGVNWKHVNKNGQNMVHIAAEWCNVEGLKFVLNKGLHINALDSYGSTPLHRVARFGKENILETVRLLISSGANTKLKNWWGDTPLDYLNMNINTIIDKNKVVELLSK